MSQDLIEAGRADPAIPARAVALGAGANVGAIAIEQERAIAEAQGKLVLAKRFPRDLIAAEAEFMQACKSPEFAAAAFYSVPNRGSGPSIRFAEEVARCYGNFQYGHKELSRTDGKSEVEVYAWDMERNNHSTRQITVMHVRDKQGGATPLKDQTDIDNRIANVASKQIRGRILALMPKHLVAAGIAECKKTLAGDNDKPIRDRIMAMAAAFGKIGVTVDMLATHLGHPLDDTTVDELADMHGIFVAIKEGAKASEFFGAKEDGDTDAATALTAAGKDAAAEPKPAKETKAKAPPKDAAPEGEKAAAEQPKDAAPPAEEPKAQEQAPPPAEAAQEPAQAQTESNPKPAAERREAVF